MKRFIIVFILMVPIITVPYADKFLFSSLEMCRQCLREIKAKNKKSKKKYRCAVKENRPGKDQYFVVMTFSSNDEKEFFKELDSAGEKTYSRKREKTVTRQRRGLKRQDIMKLCPEIYMKAEVGKKNN